MSTQPDTGIVLIHGKEYQTVALRVQKFRETHPEWALETSIIQADPEVVIMRCEIKDEAGRMRATGHGEEVRGSSQINRTSALENCETSAIGRALASLGLGGTEFASADEFANAIQQQNGPPPAPRINRPRAQQYIKGIELALHEDDALCLKELNDELKPDENMLSFVWNYFSTEQKTNAKALLHTLREK